MIRHFAARLALGMALTGCSIVWATGPTSTNYAIPSSTLNAGVGDMASASYKVSSSLGDPFFAGAMSSSGYQLNPGFWGAVIGPIPLCLLDIDGDGSRLAFKDGILLVRYLLGIRGAGLVQGLTLTGSRTDFTSIQDFIALQNYNVDAGSTAQQAFVDGVILVRLMLGIADGTLLTSITIPAGAAFTTAAAIRANVNATCGTSF